MQITSIFYALIAFSTSVSCLDQKQSVLEARGPSHQLQSRTNPFLGRLERRSQHLTIRSPLAIQLQHVRRDNTDSPILTRNPHAFAKAQSLIPVMSDDIFSLHKRGTKSGSTGSGSKSQSRAKSAAPSGCNSALARRGLCGSKEKKEASNRGRPVQREPSTSYEVRSRSRSPAPMPFAAKSQVTLHGEGLSRVKFPGQDYKDFRGSRRATNTIYASSKTKLQHETTSHSGGRQEGTASGRKIWFKSNTTAVNKSSATVNWGNSRERTLDGKGYLQAPPSPGLTGVSRAGPSGDDGPSELRFQGDGPIINVHKVNAQR